MRGLASLLVVQVRGTFGINRTLHSHDPRQRRRLALLGCCVVLIAIVFGAYAGVYASALASMGARDAIPALAVALGSLAGVGTTFLKANGQLFGFRDFDLVMSLPLPTWQVIVSRVGALYGMNLLCALVLAGPMLGAWVASGSWAPAQAAGVVGALVLVCLCMPLLPIAVTTILAYGLAALAARMRRAKAAVGLLGLLAMIALVIGSFALSGTMGEGPDAGAQMAMLADVSEALENIVCGAYPPAAWASAGLAVGEPGWLAGLAAFVGVSLAAAVAVVAVMARWFVPINASLEAGARSRGGVQESGRRGSHARRSPLAALTAKELRLLLNTPAYLMNTATGPVLALVFSIALAVIDPQAIGATLAGELGAGAGQALSGAGLEGLLLALSPWVLAFCFAIAPTSASATSLEGSARWIMQTAPLPARTVLGSKVAANLALCVPAALVSAAVAGVGLGAGPVQLLALACAPLSAGLLCACLGAYLDARAPRYDWTSEYEVVKRSAAVAITCVVGMALVFGAGALTWMAGTWAPLVTIGLALVFAGAACVFWARLARIDLADDVH